MQNLLRLLLCAATLVAARGQESVAFHEQRAAARPGDGDAIRLLANALIARAEKTANGSDYDRAAQVLDQADRLDPWFEPNILARARLLLSRHRFMAARALSEEALRRWPNHSAFLEIAGDGALEAGDLAGAQLFYQRLHAKKPEMSSYARLAHLEELTGNLEKARDLQRKALEAAYQGFPAPAESRAWCRAVLGEYELKLGNPQATRDQYQTALKDSPDHPLVLEHLAELEVHENHPAQAIATYRKLLQQGRNPVNELRLVALLEGTDPRQATELRARALAFLEQAVASGNEGYLRPLAEQRLVQGRFEEAAALQVRDVMLRPTPDACAVLETIAQDARKAGKPLQATGLGVCAQKPLRLPAKLITK